MKIIDELLMKKPFGMEQTEKEKVFLEVMKESMKHHYQNCKEFRKFIDSQKFNLESEYCIEDIPFLPVSIFKEMDLITGNRENIKKKVLSSSTSGNKPSSIYLDLDTINRQRKALVSILPDFIGRKKKVFFIFDSESTINALGGEVSSRGSAIRGMLIFSKSIKFLLDDDLEMDLSLLEDAVESLEKDDEVCFFGFTWIMYKILSGIKSDKNFSRFCELFESLKGKGIVLHIGGWKKLEEISITKKKFNEEVGSLMKVPVSGIVDFYGMTEQLGTVYPDCEFGFKHVPLYSEVIVRNVENFKQCSIGEEGFIQVLSPIPNSYPGISILSDDLGELKGVDDCKCKRLGKYFVFKKRADKAEAKGCGDTYEE